MVEPMARQVLARAAMKRLVISLLPVSLVACYGGERRHTGNCPAGEVCSELTPRGLDFIGNQLVGELLLSGPRPTAVGGTQTIALEYDRGDGVDIPLDLPFTADDDGGRGIRVHSVSGSQVTVLGVDSRSNYLRILDEDGLLMDRKELTGAALERIELVTADFENVPDNRPLAFASGPRTFGIALYGDVQTSSGRRSERIVDTQMEVSLAGVERVEWDTFELDAKLGTHTMTVTAGDKPPATLDFVVADLADSLAVLEPAPTTISPGSSTTVCFEAVVAGRYIAGLSWTFVVDGVTTVQGDETLMRNCISVTTEKTSGTVSIQASAAGQTTSLTLGVGAMARESKDALAAPQVRATSYAIPTAGDRASL